MAKNRVHFHLTENQAHSKRSSLTPVDRIKSMKVSICKLTHRRPRPSEKFEVRPRATRKLLAGVSHTVISSSVAEGEAKSLTCLYCNRDPNSHAEREARCSGACCHPVLGDRKVNESLGSLALQPSLLNELQANWRACPHPTPPKGR